MTLGKLPWIDDRAMFFACSFAQKMMQGSEQYPAKGIDDACAIAGRKYGKDPEAVKELVQTTVPGIFPEKGKEAQGAPLASLDGKLDRILSLLEKGQGSPAPEVSGQPPIFDDGGGVPF